ncbi:serine acetyltransferase [Bradyrhizobium ontarionense]|uniref:serine O-acetyltransferase n=1 Tax=Bradyrhizobium ontarionense TaxID=2898149 RepID=A0ABY3RE52_9BRAD|nr:serine O-acetyltransferase EpsC [Bradyrhizobium sp. A19]UFZ05111.1 serine acetyltransferase [Bradyrhizobium sp. A19]
MSHGQPAGSERLTTGSDLTDSSTSSPRWDLDRLVTELRISREETHSIRKDGVIHRPPSRDKLAQVISALTEALFPRHYGQYDLDGENIDYFVGHRLSVALDLLSDQIHRSALFVGDELIPGFRQPEAVELTRSFAAELPALRGVLISDLRAAFVGDPAAKSFPEILIGYPGMTAIIHHRLAHLLYGFGARLVARLIAEIAHTRTGIDIHPGATIGSGFFIDHGTGVVIGETAIIGDHVRIYQAVTLGARHFPTDDDGSLIKGDARHPIVEDDVVIYAGATILGRITIGRGSTIGGNVWLTNDVPPNNVVTQASLRNKVGSPNLQKS